MLSFRAVESKTVFCMPISLAGRVAVTVSGESCRVCLALTPVSDKRHNIMPALVLRHDMSRMSTMREADDRIICSS